MSEKPNQHKWWILTAMCLLTAMLNLDVTAINLGIPVIAHEFHASLADMQWVINAYVLFSAMFQIFGGRIGDTYGHKKIYLIGTILFILGSAGAGIAMSESMLIIFRIIQGIALGIAYPMTIVLTFAAFPKKQQGFALSFIVATMGISLAVGPPIGGFFVDTIGWRWIFYINVPIGIIACLIAWIYCAPHKEKNPPRIDYLGAAFLSLGLLGVLLAFNQVQNWGFTSFAFWISLILGLLLLVCLFWSEKKHVAPIINFNLFKHRNFLLNNLIRFIVQLVFVSSLFFFPLYLINISGFSPLMTGILLLFLTVVIGLISPVAGIWVDHVGDKLPNALSMLLFAIAYVLLYFLDVEPNLWILGIGLILIGVATGISFVSTVTGSLSVIPEKEHGVGSGIIFTTAWFGCGAGVAFMGAIVAMSSRVYLQNNLPKITLSATQISALERVGKGLSSYDKLKEIIHIQPLESLIQLARSAFMHGFRLSFAVWIVLSLIGVALSLSLKPLSKN